MQNGLDFRSLRPNGLHKCYRVTIIVLSVTALLALTTFVHYEYDQNHLVIYKSQPTIIPLDVARIYQGKTLGSPKHLLLDAYTKFFGEIVFENANKTIACKPQITFSGGSPATMSMNLNCFEKLMESDTFWANVTVACSKAAALLLFIYTVMWWNYFLLAEGSFLWGADRNKVSHNKSSFVKVMPNMKMPIAELKTTFEDPHFKITEIKIHSKK